MSRIATIDVGTNSILLLIADVAPDGEIRVVDDRCRIERLGRGVDKTGVLDPAAIARGLDALTEFAAAIKAAGALKVAAIGTQALREAKNGKAFLEPAQKLLGVPIEVIGGRREAELAFRAVLKSFPALARGPLVVMDVGGGSTELIVGANGSIESLVSVPIGSVRMAERYLHGDPPTADEAAALIAGIDEALAPHALPSHVPLVGTAGTVTTLAAVSVGLEPYEPDEVQGMKLSRADVDEQLARYLNVTNAERSKIAGLDPKRADVIPAGCAIVARVMARMDVASMTVSDHGIRFGLLAELAGRH